METEAAPISALPKSVAKGPPTAIHAVPVEDLVTKLDANPATGLTEAELFALIDSFRSPDLWDKRDGEWVLKHCI